MAETRPETLRVTFNKTNPTGKRKLLKMLRKDGFTKSCYEDETLCITSSLKPEITALHVAMLASFAFEMDARYRQVKADGAKEFAVELY